MLCPLKFNSFPHEVHKDSMGKELFNAVCQCEKEKCGWWVKANRLKNIETYKDGCAMKLIAENKITEVKQ